MYSVIEAIVLHATQLNGRKQLAVVISDKHGLLTIAIGKQKGMSFVTPLMRLEATVIPSEKEIWRSTDIAILDTYYKLRTSFSFLQHAVFLAKFLHEQLLFHTKTEKIYAMYKKILQELPSFKYTETATVAFLLKYALFEGVFPSKDLFNDQEGEVLKYIVSNTFEEMKGLFIQKSTRKKLYQFFTYAFSLSIEGRILGI